MSMIVLTSKITIESKSLATLIDRSMAVSTDCPGLPLTSTTVTVGFILSPNRLTPR